MHSGTDHPAFDQWSSTQFERETLDVLTARVPKTRTSSN